jgi:O-antigen chain-terminating methyltransferase
MADPPASTDDLARLRAARLDADRRYNDALTALDAAIQAAERTRDLPPVPPAPDESGLPAIARQWQIVPEGGPGARAGWLRRRATRLLWTLIGPVFERQQAFNASLVDHIHRGVPVLQRTRETIDGLLAVLREQRGALATLHTRLIQQQQQITPYVDTKDREFAAIAVPRLTEFADRLGRQGETIAVAHQLALVVKREIDRLAAGGALPAATAAGASATNLQQAAARTLDAYKYVGFEDRFRGSRDEIRARQTDYLPVFAGGSEVLDVGCGRGEFLDLLAERGIGGRGLDVNHEMAELCRARGLDVVEADALEHLQSLPNASLGGLFAAQVVEHLQPDYLLALLEAAFLALRPGTPIVLETINPACWTAFFESYIRDITHVRPIHPDTLKYLLTATGFHDVTVRYSSPYPEPLKLQPVTGDDEASRTFNANVEKVNRLLFTYMDYAAVARRP